MSRIFISLDELLDTKLTILKLVDERLAKEYILDGHRITDTISYLDHRCFKHLYNGRTKEVLKTSISTNMEKAIKDILMDIKSQKIKMNISEPTILDISTYPYKLSEEENKELFDIFTAKYGNACTVNLITDNLDTMNFHDMSKIYTHIVRYYGLEWLNSNILNGNIKKYPMNNTLLMIPIILNHEVPKTDEDLEKLLTYIENAHLSYIKLNFLNSVLFSAHKIKKDNT